MMVAIVLNGLCLHCEDINLFLVIRFVQGMFAANVIVFTLMLIFSRIEPTRAPTVGPAVFYGTMLSNVVLVGLVGGVVVESADWKVTYEYLILFELVTMVIVLVMLKQSSGRKSYPLYQIDWAGMVIFAGSALGLAYTIIYGSKYYWFSDARICYSSLAAVVGSILFLHRQHTLKRPVIHLAVFKSPDFVVAVCILAVYYGSKDSVNLIYNYAAGILRWSTFQVICLGLCNMAAMVIALIFCSQLLLRKHVSIMPLLIIGFGLMGAFNLWMSTLLTSDLDFADLLIPIIVQGGASGFLFVPIMINVLSSAPPNTGMSGLIIGACTRFTATLHSIAGFYNLQLYYNQYFREGFLGNLTPENQNTIARMNSYRSFYISKGFSFDQGSALANVSISQTLSHESQLQTNRTIFMIFGFGMILLAIVMMVIPMVRKAWRRCLISFNSAQGVDRNRALEA